MVEMSLRSAAASIEIKLEDHDDTIQREEMMSTEQSNPIAQRRSPWSTPIENSAGTDDPSLMHKPISKKAMKKAARAERLAATKLERRAREKQAKKEKKRIQVEKRTAGELDKGTEGEEKKSLSKTRKIVFGGKVIVDLGFDKMMTDKVSWETLYAWFFYPILLININIDQGDHVSVFSISIYL